MKQETNKFKRFWIAFWYNDYTRILGVMMPSYMIIVIPLLKLFGYPDEYLKNTIFFLYFSVFMWAFMDNDYSNLRRIGLDENRRKLTPKELDT